MSRQDLYQILGLHGYRVTNVERDEKQLFVHARPQPHRVCCSACGGRDVVRRGETTRTIRNLPIGADCTWVVVALPRVQCRNYGLVRQVKIGFTEEPRTYTRAFERYVLEMCRYMTLIDVARHLGVSWDIVKDVQKRYLGKHFAKPPLKQTRYLAIDEICIGHGYQFLTLVLDFQTGTILFAGKGKKAAALTPFWRRLRASGAKIKAVAMDLSAAYRSAVKKNLPRYDRLRSLSHHQALQREAGSTATRVASTGDRRLAQAGAQGNPLAATEESGESRPGERRTGSPEGGAAVERVAVDGVLLEGRPEATLEPGDEVSGAAQTARLVSPNDELRGTGVAELCPHAAEPPGGYPRLV